jgi:hypothetical protein
MLFPYLVKLHDCLIRGDPRVPVFWLSQRRHPSPNRKTQHQHSYQPRQSAPKPAAPAPVQHQSKMAAKVGSGPEANFSSSSDTGNTPPDYTAYISEMQEVTAMLAAMTVSPMQGLNTGMTVPPPPPTHGGTCRVMGTNQAYTSAMRNASCWHRWKPQNWGTGILLPSSQFFPSPRRVSPMSVNPFTHFLRSTYI